MCSRGTAWVSPQRDSGERCTEVSYCHHRVFLMTSEAERLSMLICISPLVKCPLCYGTGYLLLFSYRSSRHKVFVCYMDYGILGPTVLHPAVQSLMAKRTSGLGSFIGLPYLLLCFWSSCFFQNDLHCRTENSLLPVLQSTALPGSQLPIAERAFFLTKDKCFFFFSPKWTNFERS